jgi:hypothetical protein
MDFKKIVANRDLTVWAVVPVVNDDTPPNKLAYVTSRPKIGVLILTQAANELFPVSHRAMDSLKEAVERKRFDDAYVVLVSPTGEFLNAGDYTKMKKPTQETGAQS